MSSAVVQRVVVDAARHVSAIFEHHGADASCSISLGLAADCLMMAPPGSGYPARPGRPQGRSASRPVWRRPVPGGVQPDTVITSDGVGAQFAAACAMPPASWKSPCSAGRRLQVLAREFRG